MIRCLCLAVFVATCGFEIQPLIAQGPVDCSLTVPVKAVGQGTTIFQDFVFQPGTSTFPGISSGELLTGGLGVREVKILVAQQVERTVYRYVLVFENGRPRLVREARVVVETIHVEVNELRQILLPEVRGHWTAIDLCLFSSWSLFYLGPDGLIIGAGGTAGDQLFGGALYVGVAGIPTGWYQLSTGGPNGDGGGDPGGGGDPPPEP